MVWKCNIIITFLIIVLPLTFGIASEKEISAEDKEVIAIMEMLEILELLVEDINLLEALEDVEQENQ